MWKWKRLLKRSGLTSQYTANSKAIQGDGRDQIRYIDASREHLSQTSADIWTVFCAESTIVRFWNSSHFTIHTLVWMWYTSKTPCRHTKHFHLYPVLQEGGAMLFNYYYHCISCKCSSGFFFSPPAKNMLPLRSLYQLCCKETWWPRHRRRWHKILMSFSLTIAGRFMACWWSRSAPSVTRGKAAWDQRFPSRLCSRRDTTTNTGSNGNWWFIWVIHFRFHFLEKLQNTTPAQRLIKYLWI